MVDFYVLYVWDVQNSNFISVQFQFSFWKKTLIQFGMSLVRLCLKKNLVRIGFFLVIYYFCNAWVVNIQQILQRYCAIDYVEILLQNDLLCVERDVKH